eukprot:CAMPEP_0172671034 /NCGR_PEP_ID=MMETSP1074-20121228/10658_1 /TAXON_ID=2916 /ORGANISM="Ceratium fusus, Strain PA161109" /LENGTH=58 /DNA_ID=CAMNT_0013488019 /DNA_START=819 /DNA_END=992 /DNA_ORIENTATION=-
MMQHREVIDMSQKTTPALSEEPEVVLPQQLLMLGSVLRNMSQNEWQYIVAALRKAHKW